MTDLRDALTATLKTIPDLLGPDGEVVKARVEERAMRLDADLLRALMGEEALRSAFFQEVDGMLVFDKVRLVETVRLRDFLPDSFTVYGNKIGLSSAGGSLRAGRDVVLDWPYKDCVLMGGMTREDRGGAERFVNRIVNPGEIIRLEEPKALSGWEKWDAAAVEAGAPGAVTAEDVERAPNLLLKGNNLLALHSLAQSYAKAVDCVYLDPPYNTGSADDPFSYNNRFKRSSWLTFMSNRLRAVKRLLRPDGVLIVAIDENELFHLGVLLHEEFPGYKVHPVAIVHNPRGVQGVHFSYNNEYALFVVPDGQKVISRKPGAEGEIDWSPFRNWGGESLRTDAKNCFYPVLVKAGEVVGVGERTPDGEHPRDYIDEHGIHHVYPVDGCNVERKWRYALESAREIIGSLRAVEDGESYRIDIGKSDKPFKTVWSDTRYDANIHGKQLLKDLVPDTTFSFPKSLWTVYDCLYAVVASRPKAIVLDAFGGSGTTGHAVFELNKRLGGERAFLLAEQMDYVRSTTSKRLKAVIARDGGGSFLYAEIAGAGQDFVARVDAAEDEALPALRDELLGAPYLRHDIDPAGLRDPWDALEKPADRRRALREAVAADHLHVNVPDMDDEDAGLSEEDRTLTRAFYGMPEAAE